MTPEPQPEEAVAELREGLERAHELVAEAKLTMRQLGDEPSDPVLLNRAE